MLVTVEFQRGKSFASVSRVQMLAAGARMLSTTPHVIEKTPRDCVMLAVFIESACAAAVAGQAETALQ
jgi:hypothetical protein